MDHDYLKKNGDYFDSDRSSLLPHLPATLTRLLDVGCSGGTFGAQVKRSRGIEVWGIEPFPDAAARAAEKLDKVLAGTAETCLPQVPDGHFDCISFNDVLEHLPDPWGVLSLVRPKLSPGGVLFACIPNVLHHSVLGDLLFEGDWRYRAEGVLDQTHLRFFTRRSMVRMMEESGFQVISVEGLVGAKVPRRLRWLDRLAFAGGLRDMKFLQFVVLARPRP
ncbi:MAG: class I SAM-dependent methyltransferase [Acidobacteria bacterium]|nr:class I SAM-dependent methyltransferase [Acidobacteriota bacterium]